MTVVRYSRLAVLLYLATISHLPAHARTSRPVSAQPPPLIIYASVKDVGLFKTVGTSGVWQGPSPLISTALSLSTLDQAHWRTVFAGLADGLYISQDGAATWSPTGLHGHPVYAIEVDPRNVNSITVGTDRGTYHSADGGTTWSQGTSITIQLRSVVAGSAPNGLYAAGNSHVYLSTDGGAHWKGIDQGLPSRQTINALAVAPTRPYTLYAAGSLGVWQQVNGTWTALGHGLPARAYATVSVDAGHVLVCSQLDPTLYVSADGGLSWTHRPIKGLSTGIYAFAQDPSVPSTLIAGDANGNVAISSDYGVTWAVPGGAVAGTVGSPVNALAVIRRPVLPSDGVANPHRSDIAWFDHNGGHTLRDPFLSYWTSVASAPDAIGYPLTEEFNDPHYGNAPAQIFDHMELVQTADGVYPAPLGADLAPAAYVNSCQQSCAVDPTFQAFWSAHGGADVLGPPVTPAFRQSINDGTGHQYLVQYFRNTRLEFHPELSGAGDDVRAGALGTVRLLALGWT